MRVGSYSRFFCMFWQVTALAECPDLQYLVNEITTCYHKHRKKKEGTGVL